MYNNVWLHLFVNNYKTSYRRDTCFDAHLFRRLFCLYHVMLCARSDDVTACFFVCKYHCFTLSRKNKCKVRDSKVRNNRFCQCIAVWSHFLRFKITHYIEAKFSPSWKKMTKLLTMSATLFHFSFGDVRVMWLNFLKMIKFHCVV